MTHAQCTTSAQLLARVKQLPNALEIYKKVVGDKVGDKRKDDEPKEAIDRAFAEQPQQAAEEQQAAGAPVVGGGGDVHVGVVVDVSRSCAPMAEARLACLVCRSGAQTHPGGAGARATCYSRVRALCWDRTR